MSEVLTYDLVILEDALQEISEQAQYYEEQSETGLALRWSEAALQTVQSIRIMPHRCAPYRLSRASRRDLRRIPVRGFEDIWIFFEADDSLVQITVVAVLHMARNVQAILHERRS